MAERSRFSPDRFLRRLVVVTMLALFGASSLATVLVTVDYHARVEAEFRRTSRIAGEVVGRQVERALELGFPLAKLADVPAYLAEHRERFDGIEGVALAGPTGEILFSSGYKPGADEVVRVPVAGPSGAAGAVLLTVDRGGAWRRTLGVLADALIVLLVVSVVGFEFITLFVGISIKRPLGVLSEGLARLRAGRFDFAMPAIDLPTWSRAYQAVDGLVRRVGAAAQDARAEIATLGYGPDTNRRATLEKRLDDTVAGLSIPQTRPVLEPPQSASYIRAPVLLFVLAEELSRPFLPLFAKSLATDPALQATAAGLAISVFMITVALATPVASALAERFGFRVLFVLGMVPGVIGYLATGFADGVGMLVVGRVLSGMAYAIIYIVCQGYAADAGAAEGRTRSMAIFMGAVFAATICGPALGGVLADRLGTTAVLTAAAASCLVATLLAIGLVPAPAPIAKPRMGLPTIRQMGAMWTDSGMALLTLLIAIPAKFALAGFLFYLLPIHLTAIGASASEIGRIMMIYGIANLLLTPIAARLADRGGDPARLVLVGTLLSGLGPLLLIATGGQELGWIAVAVLVFGLGHGLAIAPQLGLVTLLADRSTRGVPKIRLLAAFRFYERLGSVLGPLAVVWLAANRDAVTVMAIVGGVVVVAGLLWWVLWSATARSASPVDVTP